jgi:hypothetical protein
MVTVKEPVTNPSDLKQRPIVNLLHTPQLAADKQDKPAVHELVENIPHDVKIEQAWVGEGLGTFIDLDGEMVVLEGVCYRVTSDGLVTTVEGDRLIPYAVVTRFTAEFAKRSQQCKNFSELVAVCDALRSSANVRNPTEISRVASPLGSL